MSFLKKLLLLWIVMFLFINCINSGLAFAETNEKQDYIIRSEDVLQIKVYEHPDLTTNGRVTAKGDITFPLIGQVQVEGLTIKQICSKIRKLLMDGYLVNPQVDVFIESYHPEQIFVMGEVRSPSAYQLARDKKTTVLEAISIAGGFTEKAARNKTRVIRMNNAGKGETIKIKITDITKKGDKSKDIPLKANDIVFVPESMF